MSAFTFGFNYGRAKKAGGVSYDADAETFFTAASITDTTQKSAVNQLVLDLKSYGVWNKCKAIYPIVGGSAGSHAVNLKTPGTYNLTFATGWTHASTGMTPNGTTYADTFLIPSTTLSLNSSHLSYYSRSNINVLNQYEIGCSSISGVAQYNVLVLRDNNLMYSAINVSAAPSASNTDSTGLFIANRTASNVLNGFRNSSKLINASTSSTVLPTNKISIGAMNSGTIGFYTQKQCAFASIGDGLTDTEAANFYTAVQAYQTTLSRNV